MSRLCIGLVVFVGALLLILHGPLCPQFPRTLRRKLTPSVTYRSGQSAVTLPTYGKLDSSSATAIGVASRRTFRSGKGVVSSSNTAAANIHTELLRASQANGLNQRSVLLPLKLSDATTVKTGVEHAPWQRNHDSAALPFATRPRNFHTPPVASAEKRTAQVANAVSNVRSFQYSTSSDARHTEAVEKHVMKVPTAQSPVAAVARKSFARALPARPPPVAVQILPPLNLEPNKVSLLYVVGVEGSGLHNVASAIAAVGKTCKQHVIRTDPLLLKARRSRNELAFHDALSVSKASKFEQRNVLVVDEQPFPTQGMHTNTTSAAKKRLSALDIEWVYDQVARATNVSLKIVYVNRNLGVGAADADPLLARVEPTAEMTNHIAQEHAIINAKEHDVWTQVSYESFAHMSNCTTLVSAVADFMQWSVCDVAFACETLTRAVQQVSPMETATAEALQSQDTRAPLYLPSIPQLDLSALKVHTVQTYVSDRKAFSSPVWRAAHKQHKVVSHTSSAPPVNSSAVKSLSYLYVVGVEGTGHHGVTPAIAAIAKMCNYKVLYEDTKLRSAWSRSLPQAYRNALQFYQQYEGKMIIIEDQSFPVGHVARVSTPEKKKGAVLYNLEWIYNQNKAVGVETKFLHLTRDFYRAVASHPEFDDGFEPHAWVLYDFLQHIRNEYQLIDERAPGLWREMQYEAFTQMRNCTALVSAVVEFMQWGDCDIARACETIAATVRVSNNTRTYNATDIAIARSFDTTLPIPLLDIAPRDVYNFSTVPLRV